MFVNFLAINNLRHDMTNHDKGRNVQKSLINWEFKHIFTDFLKSISKTILTFFVNMFEYRCGNHIEA